MLPSQRGAIAAADRGMGWILRTQHAEGAAECVLLLVQIWTPVSLNLWKKDLTK